MTARQGWTTARLERRGQRHARSGWCWRDGNDGTVGHTTTWLGGMVGEVRMMQM